MRRIALLGALLIAVLAAALVRGSGPEKGLASSHREAPRIMVDPSADNTDVYAFVSPDRPDTVTIVANYIPLEEPAGGPNFNEFADDVLYELKVDNNGDGREDVSYQFEFSTQTRNGNTFLYNTGPIDTLSDTDWNRPQTYKVTRVSKGKTTILAKGVPTPPVNIGPRSTPNYGSLMQAAVRQLPGGIKVFAGQSDDPFFVDLGSVFDLAGLRPFNPAHVIPLNADDGVDGVGGFNTHAIVLQVPITQLTRDGKLHAADDMKGVIGVYATANRRRLQVIDSNGRRRSAGDWVQVSRLAEPLINEVVIPLGKKDRWNASDPSGDASFASHYTSPEVTRLANLLYPVLDNAPESGRGDIATILLTGVPGLNYTGPDAGRPHPPEHRHRADWPGRHGEPARSPRRRLRRVPERPAARGRRDRHRAPRAHVRLRPDRRPVDRELRLLLRQREPLAEQPARRRGRRERPPAPRVVPVRRGAAPGLRARPPRRHGWAVAEDDGGARLAAAGPSSPRRGACA